MQFRKISTGITLIYATLLAFVNPIQSVAQGLPSGGPPAPILMGINLEGPVSLDEGTPAQYTCIGKYSDATTAAIDAIWEINTLDAAISSSGLLSVGNISVDQNVTITASVGGYSQTLDLVLQAVAPVLTGITISGPSTLAEDASAQYTCSASYLDGTTLSVVPSWTVSSSSGGMDAAGILTAKSVDSEELISIEASFNGKTDTFSVTIIDGLAILESLTIQGSVSMDENTSIQLNCIAQYSDGSSPLINPLWSVGSSSAQITQAGLLSAGDVTGDVGVIVTASLNGLTDSLSVLIKYVAPVLERIEVTGPSAVAEEEAAGYTCTAYYNDGTSKVVRPEWNENSSYATMSSWGGLRTLDVPSDQSLTLTATYGGKSDSVGVQIISDIPVLLSLSIEGVAIVEEHASTQYSCTASYSDGTSLEVDPVWAVSSELALVSIDGNLSAGEVGKDELVGVTASYGGLNASFEIVLKDVLQQVLLQSLTISGAGEVEENASIALTCQASYSDGSIQTVTPEWSIASAQASIGSDGLFEAENVESDVIVEVTASFGGLEASHTISVAVFGTQIIYPLSGFEGKTVMAELYNYETGDWTDYGPSESPAELVLEDLGTNGWYWISISESNTTSGAWDEVQANWLHL